MIRSWRPSRLTAALGVAALASAAVISGAVSAAAAPAACGSLGFQTTDHAPGLAGLGSRLYVAWTGTNGVGGLHGNLNFISTDGTCYGARYTSPQTSSAGPAIASYKSKLWAAWVGTDSGHHLNLMSSPDGMSWSKPTTFSAESSDATPALVAFSGTLYLAWVGTDHVGYGHLNILATTDGVTYTKHIFTSAAETSPALSGPGLTQFSPNGNKVLELGWAGTNNPSTVWVDQLMNGSWINEHNTGFEGFAPALSPDGGGGVEMATRDANLQVQLYDSSDGVNFRSQGATGVYSNDDQALALFGVSVWMAYTYVNSNANDQLAVNGIT